MHHLNGTRERPVRFKIGWLLQVGRSAHASTAIEAPDRAMSRTAPINHGYRRIYAEDLPSISLVVPRLAATFDRHVRRLLGGRRQLAARFGRGWLRRRASVRRARSRLRHFLRSRGAQAECWSAR